MIISPGRLFLKFTMHVFPSKTGILLAQRGTGGCGVKIEKCPPKRMVDTYKFGQIT